MDKNRKTRIDYLKGLQTGRRSLHELIKPSAVLLTDPAHPGNYIDENGKLYTDADISTLFPNQPLILLPDNGRNRRKDHVQ